MDARLISIVDLAPSLLQMANVEVPDFMQGADRLGSKNSRDYVFAGRDRMDQTPDWVRAARDGRYKYIRNYRPELAYFRPLVFRDMFPVMQALWAGREAATLNDSQRFYFTAPRPSEELYDTQQDPQELVNLAAVPAHAQTLNRLRAAMDDWLARVGDKSAVAESEMIEAMWPSGKQPVTAMPSLARNGQKLALHSTTPGASVALRFKAGGIAGGMFADTTPWQLYVEPITLPVEADVTLEAKAIRYGFAPSEVATFSIR